MRMIDRTLIGKTEFEWGRKTYVMGVVNVTPDSFSGDGLAGDVNDALGQARKFEEWGADILDIGGESTRPASLYKGARSISVDEELSRVIPVVEALSREVNLPISVDTTKSVVAKQALASGAAAINDIWGFRKDPEMATVAADANVPVVLMHNQDHTRYDDLVPDVIAALADLVEQAVAAGVNRENIILDPGMGFGKTAQHNLEILRRLREFTRLGHPLLVGMSRKSTIGQVLGLPVGERVEGTAATVALSVANGADMVRVHDVKEMVRVARMADAIVRGWEPE